MNNLPISRTIFKEKAINYAQEIQDEEFHALNRRFGRWKARLNVSFKSVAAEQKIGTPEMTSSWWERHLSTILSRFELKDIYDGDGFRLFYQALPTKTIEL